MCPSCKTPIEQVSIQEIVDRVSKFKDEDVLLIMAPLVDNRKGEFQDLFETYLKAFEEFGLMEDSSA